MAENQLFPVFDLPELPDNPEYEKDIIRPFILILKRAIFYGMEQAG